MCFTETEVVPHTWRTEWKIKDGILWARRVPWRSGHKCHQLQKYAWKSSYGVCIGSKLRYLLVLIMLPFAPPITISGTLLSEIMLKKSNWNQTTKVKHVIYIFAGLWVNAATYLPCRYIKSWHFCESVHLIWTFMKFASSSHCGNCSDCKCCHVLTLPRLPSFGQVCCDYCWFSHDDYSY